MSTTTILPHVRPLPTKDVRRVGTEHHAYLVYSDGTERLLGVRQWSWEAYQLCDDWMWHELQQRPLVAEEAR